MNTHKWSHFNFKVVKLEHRAGRRSKFNYQCTTCEEMVKCHASIRRHYGQVHLNGTLQQRTCRYCNESFKLYDEFKAHVEQHSKVFICMTCGEALATSLQLHIHMKVHKAVPEEEKRLMCDMCGFRAQQKATIEAHMVREHGATKSAGKSYTW